MSKAHDRSLAIRIVTSPGLVASPPRSPTTLVRSRSYLDDHIDRAGGPDDPPYHWARRHIVASQHRRDEGLARA